MQLVAKDNLNTIQATSAHKGREYLCPECETSVRVRRGPRRQPHFYHIKKQRSCRQHKKSLEHLHVQIRLVKLLGRQAEMECRFLEIGRIADVVCHARKCVYEIQCSPISVEEVKRRSEDYREAGYEVVWILHDRRFNQKRVSEAESHLRNNPCYFTNCNRVGRGIIYDQFEVIKNHKRMFKGPPLIIEPDCLIPVQQAANAPLAIQKRMESWTIYAKGDLLERYLRGGSQQIFWIEQKYARTKKRLGARSLLGKLYLALFNSLLAKLTFSRWREK